MPKLSKLSIPLEDLVLIQLDSLIPEMEQSSAVQEFGIQVTREVVARVALMRGLRAMQAGVGGRVKAAEKTSEPAQGAPSAQDTPEPNWDSVTGQFTPPDGWEQWLDAEPIPETQTDLHAYYVGNGWERWYGSVGEDGKGRERIVFYWNKNAEAPELGVFGGKESGILLQNTPWGPGHLVPSGWGSEGAGESA